MKGYTQNHLAPYKDMIVGQMNIEVHEDVLLSTIISPCQHSWGTSRLGCFPLKFHVLSPN
jgi:hypothetical protein